MDYHKPHKKKCNLTQTHRPNAGFEEYDPSADHSITYRSPASADSTGNIRHIWDHHISSYVIIPFLDFLGIADIISSKKTCEKENVQTHTHMFNHHARWVLVQPPLKWLMCLVACFRNFPGSESTTGRCPRPGRVRPKLGAFMGKMMRKYMGWKWWEIGFCFPNPQTNIYLGLLSNFGLSQPSIGLRKPSLV